MHGFGVISERVVVMVGSLVFSLTESEWSEFVLFRSVSPSARKPDFKSRIKGNPIGNGRFSRTLPVDGR